LDTLAIAVGEPVDPAGDALERLEVRSRTRSFVREALADAAGEASDDAADEGREADPAAGEPQADAS
jgi:hypothetical protein